MVMGKEALFVLVLSIYISLAAQSATWESPSFTALCDTAREERFSCFVKVCRYKKSEITVRESSTAASRYELPTVLVATRHILFALWPGGAGAFQANSGFIQDITRVYGRRSAFTLWKGINEGIF